MLCDGKAGGTMPNRIIHNPFTGETITFLATADETSGARLVFEDHIPAGQAGAPSHVHRRQQERFTVVRGTLHLNVDGRRMALREGETFAVLPDTPHSFTTRGSGEVTVRVEFEPSLDSETLFRTLAEAGRTGRLNPLMIAVLARDTQTGFYVGGVPFFLQDVLFSVLAFFARRLGYRLVVGGA